MATVKSYDDLINAEVDAIQKKIDKTLSDFNKAEQDQQTIYNKKEKLTDKRRLLEKSLKKAKNESTRLKRFIWSSDNPNIVELRNQILLVAKLIIDHPNP